MPEVRLIDKMGTDLTTVNAARVSYNRIRQEFDEERDIKLLNYLGRNQHVSPFFQPQLQFHITCPVFSARQLMRHHVGITWNELSRRYTSRNISFEWPEHSKLDPAIGRIYAEAERDALVRYERLMELGVHREQARSVLPFSLETELMTTGSLFAFYNIWKERTSPDAQSEVQTIARLIGSICQDAFPYSWEALTLHQ